MSENSYFEGDIRVHSRIVDYLSSGIYRSPGASLKELINNSFDADATKVEMFVKPDANQIIIEDNGHGMTKKEFEKHFRMISESHKRDISEITDLGRPKIGLIGIGFISANEICDVMEIISTKNGSDELLRVNINFEVMRKDPSERRGDDDTLTKADYSGITEKTEKDDHYTIVLLKNVKGEAKEIISGAKKGGYRSGKKSLYGLSHKTVSSLLKDDNLKSWSDFDEYSKTRLEIALNVPVRYHEDWGPPELKEKANTFVRKMEEFGFQVFIDGSEIRKPIVFHPEKKYLIKEFEYNGKHISASGYFYAQHGVIKPQELQGLLLRIRNAAVGEYDSSFLGFSPSIGPLFQSWISAEIYADDRLEDAMNIDRRTLRVAHPAYVELQEAVHDFLAELITEVRNKIYGSGREERRVKKAEKTTEDIFDVASREIKKISPKAANVVEESWKDFSKSDSARKIILRKYSVDELYSIVIQVAEEILTQSQLEEFIEHLTQRLQE